MTPPALTLNESEFTSMLLSSTPTSRFTVSPRDTEPPPVIAFPAVIVSELFDNLSFAIDPANISFVTPPALTLNESEFTSMLLSSTPTSRFTVSPRDTEPPPVIAFPAVIVSELFDILSFEIEPANISFVTEVFAIVRAPPAAILASPETSLNTASLTTLKSALLIVPASDMSSSSVSATSPVISVCPDIILLFSILLSIELEAIVKDPPAAIVASPEMFPKIASSRLLNVIDLMAFEASISAAYNRSS